MAERSAKGSTRLREAIGWLTIVVPFAAFAYAMVVWNMQAGLAWPWIIAGVISMNTMAFSLLTERPLQQASCLLASWGTVALGVGTFETLGGFLFGLACVAAIWKYQSRVNLARLKTSQMRERERNRDLAARLTAAGYADQRPVADNADEEGRGRNRRVTILIESRMADPEGTAGPTSIPPDDPLRSILPEDPQG